MILAMDPFCLFFSLPFILTTHALENGDRKTVLCHLPYEQKWSISKSTNNKSS